MVIGASTLLGQGATVVGAGYATPTIIRVAPGQITTIFVVGLTPDFSKPQLAAGVPLPTTLAGVSVVFNQNSLKQTTVAPLLSVQQSNLCSFGLSGAMNPVPLECTITAVTLQVPYELSTGGELSLPLTELVVTVNGVSSRTFRVSLFVDNVHVLNTCDSYPVKRTAQPNLATDCNSVVNHADGTPVTAVTPAKPGETVVIYGYGLGQTSPLPKNGEATPTPAPILGPNQDVLIQFDFDENARPSNPRSSRQFSLYPKFVGLTPGQVGLYQINVALPYSIPQIEPCTPNVACTGNPAFCPLPITSNLTIDIGGVSSFDGAAICVQPPK